METDEKLLLIIKRIFFLAYQASSVMGMGFLQEKENVSEEDVWLQVYNPAYPKEAHADYVFGRMMKLSVEWNDEKIFATRGDVPRFDYQSWAGKYPSFNQLKSSAENDVLEGECRLI